MLQKRKFKPGTKALPMKLPPRKTRDLYQLLPNVLSRLLIGSKATLAFFFVVSVFIFCVCAVYFQASLSLWISEAGFIADRAFGHITKNTSVYPFYLITTVISFEYAFRRQWVTSLFVFFVGILWMATYHSTVGYISNLGTDSFLELHSFDSNEALHFIKSFFQQFRFSVNSRTLILYSSISVMIFLLVKILFYFISPRENRYSLFKLRYAGALLVLPLTHNFYSVAFMYFESSTNFEEIRSNFSGPSPLATSASRLNVMLYIGESTSIINMQNYGYPRSTTPRLAKIEELKTSLLRFENVFSTHTHTSQSLMEALSVGLVTDNNNVPIQKRKRVSLVNVLKIAGVQTELFSNQGQTGSWNLTSSIIFAEAKKTFSTQSRYLGNRDYKLNKPFDHDFFNQEVTVDRLNSKFPSLVAFHSYAGHSPYLDNIPGKFKKPVDDYLDNFSLEAIFGADVRASKSDLEFYDSAISYIDFSVSNAIGVIDQSSAPWVFIYFADHGEAVLAGQGHDSSRFIHEMSRIPFLLYFNSAARNAAPDLFKKYEHLASEKQTSTLAQLPATIFDLMDVSVAEKLNSNSIIGSASEPGAIIIRETKEGVVGVNLTKNPLPGSPVDRSDRATQNFVAANTYQENGSVFCYHRSNGIANALRGSFVANCLELDIVIDEDNKILAYHPPAKNTGLTLGDILKSVESTNLSSIWLDGKNLDTRKTCAGLVDFLEVGSLDGLQILVEFPTGSHKGAAEIRSCVEAINGTYSAHTSYYVPTSAAVDCAEDLSNGKSFDLVRPCITLETDLLAMKRSSLFTDISFDYRGVKAIQSLGFLKDFSWNTWGVNPTNLNELSQKDFRMIILLNKDPNRN